MNLVESLLLIRTSSSRSLALTCLYSLYSSANGERSSFCTFLWEPDIKHWETREDWAAGSLSNIPSALLQNLNELCSPSILPQELVLELFQVLAQPLLLLPSLLELHHQLLPVAQGGGTYYVIHRVGGEDKNSCCTAMLLQFICNPISLRKIMSLK